MKSLQESLFDTDKNVKKDITFGDMFILNELPSLTNDHRLNLEFSVQRVKRASGISASYPGESIYKGLVKLIQNIKFDVPFEEADKDWLKNKISDLFINQNLLRTRGKDKNIYIALYRQDNLVLVHDESIFTVDTVQIGGIPGLRLVFNKKN